MLGHAEPGDQASPLEPAAINAFCLHHDNTTYASHARAFFDAWRRQEPVVYIPWEHGQSGTVAPGASSMPCPAVPGIGLGPIEHMPHVVGTPRIAFAVWETTVVPPDKIDILRSMDQVWVPSTWGRDLFIRNGIAADRVHVVPEGVDVDRFRPVPRTPASQRRFRFLFVGKWEQRKGVERLIRAYRREFAPDEPVELVLHAHNPFVPDFDLLASIRHAVGWHRTPPIVASGPLDVEGLVQLYSDCDAFVLPTCAEGWGLPVTEAMACGLPVIVTAYSAPLDYLDERIAYLIDVRAMTAVRDKVFFPSGRALGQWAQADIGSLRRILRHVFENPDEARATGRRARQAVNARWTWDHAVARARQVLRAAASSG